MASFALLRIRSFAEPAQGLAWRGRFVHNWFSNLDSCGHPVEYRGRRSPYLELAFVAAKNPDAIVPSENGRGEVRFIDRIFSCARPGHAKKLGASKARGGLVDPRPDWDDVNLAAMDFFLRQRWQPGTRDAERLVAMRGSIVEWNNWGDERWGVTLATKRGRNALGLLLEVIASELADGAVAPGAPEEAWREHQEVLVARLNDMHLEAGRELHSKAAVDRQLNLF